MKKLVLALFLIFLSAPAYSFPHGGASSAIPSVLLLDQVACLSAADAAYATVKLRSAYGGNAFQMRVKHTGTYVYQDIGFVGNNADYASADTFAATADSGTPPELRFYDQCGNGNHTTFVDNSTLGAVWSPYTLGTASARTAAFDTLYDNWSTPSTQELLLPSTMTLNMDAFSVVFIGRKASTYSAQPVAYWELTNTAPWHADWYDYNDGEHIRESSGTTLNYNTVETGQGVYKNIINATTAVIWANEVAISKSKSTLSATANNGGSMGLSQILSSYVGGQDIVAQVFYNRTLNSTEQSAVDSVGYGLVGTVPGTQDCVEVIGDSGNQASFAAYNQNPINQAIHGVGTPISKPVRLFNTATSGETAAGILANISFYTGACTQAGVTKKIAVVMAGANDINGGASAATVEATLHTIWTDMHTAGFKVVCVTMSILDAVRNGTSGRRSRIVITYNTSAR